MNDKRLVFLRVLNPVWYASIVVPAIKNRRFNRELAAKKIVSIDLYGRNFFRFSLQGGYNSFVDAERQGGHVVRHTSINLVFRIWEAGWKRKKRVFDDIRPMNPCEKRLRCVLLPAVIEKTLAKRESKSGRERKVFSSTSHPNRHGMVQMSRSVRFATALLRAKLLKFKPSLSKSLWFVGNVGVLRFKLENIQRCTQHLSILEDHFDYVGLWILLCAQFGACVEKKQIHLFIKKKNNKPMTYSFYYNRSHRRGNKS